MSTKEYPATEEFDYKIVASAPDGGHICNVEVFEELSGQWERIVDGYVKWDGCSNLNFGCVHSCGRTSAQRVARIMERIYDVAAEMMPEHYAQHGEQSAVR